MTGSPKRLLLLAAFGVLLSMPATYGTVLISDSFSLNSSNRQAGSSLPGTTTEVGGVTWSGDGSWKFTAGGMVQSASGSTDASVPLSLGSDPVTVSVDMDFAGNTTTSYGMLGLNYQTPTQPYLWTLWLFVRGNGQWALRQSGTDLASGSGLDTGAGLHELKIGYDAVTGLASAWYDGAALAADKALTAPPAVVRAGFGTSIGGLSADNFVIDVVPEPVTLALVALGAVALLRRR
jgi:hypothetical protein